MKLAAKYKIIPHALYLNQLTNFQEQRNRPARMIAILLTKEGEGPGVQFNKSERQKLYLG
jgi:hypothetical protein